MIMQYLTTEPEEFSLECAARLTGLVCLEDIPFSVTVR